MSTIAGGTQASTPSTVETSQVQFVGPEVLVANADGKVGFFGVTPVVQIASADVTDYATLKAALQSIGLIGA
jgi:hypothetical protein